MMIEEADVGGIGVRPFQSLAECALYVLERVASGQGGFAVAINAEKVVSCRRDADSKRVVEAATLRYPDGAGVVLALRLKGAPSVRVPGADLWVELLRQGAGRDLSVALIGAAPDVLAATQRRLAREFPGVRVVIARDGFSGVANSADLAADIRTHQPQVIFVAMGSPRQETLILKLREVHAGGFYFGLGGSFDVFSGYKRRAPRFMQRMGLEWLYRFLSEPTRARRETKRLAFLALLLQGRL
ncbi:MAG: WecB/TagA/CpsF family glycosyltransferase [Gammaproteobacteria bacterium]